VSKGKSYWNRALKGNVLAVTIVFVALVYLAFTGGTGDGDRDTTTVTTIEPVSPTSPTVTFPTDPPPPTVTPDPSTPPTNTPSQPPPKPVDLYLSIPDQDFELCCGLIPSKVKIWGTALIKNRGDLTAHNVGVTFELFTSNRERIKLSGEDQLERDVGDLKGGESRIENIEFTIGILEGYKIQESGGSMVLNVYSDEKSVTLEEEFVVPEMGG
jgi:hypothetical protein